MLFLFYITLLELSIWKEVEKGHYDNKQAKSCTRHVFNNRILIGIQQDFGRLAEDPNIKGL